MAKRQIVMYDNDADFPADAKIGETLPVIRGSGPRDGDLMGWGSVTKRSDGGMDFEFNPAAETWGQAARGGELKNG